MSAEQIALRVPAEADILTVLVDPEATPPVSPEVLNVTGPTVIRFKLTAGAARAYEFAHHDPVQVDDGGANFGPPHRRSDELVTLNDRHCSDGDFRYSLHVRHRKSGAPVRIDPVIRNEQ